MKKKTPHTRDIQINLASELSQNHPECDILQVLGVPECDILQVLRAEGGTIVLIEPLIRGVVV